jgi:ASTRA-associated protein 1
LRAADESALSTILPAEQTAESRPKPWLLHTLPVNTLNFCSFSFCCEDTRERSNKQISGDSNAQEQSHDAILIAVPSTDDKKIDVYGFPEEKLRFVVPKVQPIDTGMQAVLSSFLI